MDLLFLSKSSLCMLAGTCKEDRADLYKSFTCQMQRLLDIPSLEWVTLQGFYSLLYLLPVWNVTRECVFDNGRRGSLSVIPGSLARPKCKKSRRLATSLPATILLWNSLSFRVLSASSPASFFCVCLTPILSRIAIHLVYFKEVRCSFCEFSKPIWFRSNLVETFFNPFPIRKCKENWGSPCWFSRWRWSKFPWLHAQFRSGFFY